MVLFLSYCFYQLYSYVASGEAVGNAKLYPLVANYFYDRLKSLGLHLYMCE